MNDLVPSIGSSTQTNSASARIGAVLLAEDAVLRVGGLDQPRIAASASRSAMVTGLASALVSTETGVRK